MKIHPTQTGFTCGDVCVDMLDSETIRIANAQVNYEIKLRKRVIDISRVVWNGGKSKKVPCKVVAK